MVYNMDFLIAAMVILLLILWDFLGQKRADDLNNQIFLFFAVLGILDVAAELLSNYYISSGGGDFGLGSDADDNGLLSVPGPASLYPDLLHCDAA